MPIRIIVDTSLLDEAAATLADVQGRLEEEGPAFDDILRNVERVRSQLGGFLVSPAVSTGAANPATPPPALPPEPDPVEDVMFQVTQSDVAEVFNRMFTAPLPGNAGEAERPGWNDVPDEVRESFLDVARRALPHCGWQQMLVYAFLAATGSGLTN